MSNSLLGGQIPASSLGLQAAFGVQGGGPVGQVGAAESCKGNPGAARTWSPTARLQTLRRVCGSLPGLGILEAWLLHEPAPQAFPPPLMLLPLAYLEAPLELGLLSPCPPPLISRT